MRNATNSTYGFISQIFQVFFMAIQDLLRNSEITQEMQYILIAVYFITFLFLLFLLFWFLKFLITLLAKGAGVFFAYIGTSLNNPRSIPYISILVLVKSVPWYFSLLFLILAGCGLATLLTNNSSWFEAFKYILGATVGSLIGVVKKKEQAEVEDRLFEVLEMQAIEGIETTQNSQQDKK
jgi:hypothetical protein